MRGAHLQHHAGVEHVLRGRPEMDVFTKVALALRLQRLQCRHQRMFDAADFRAYRLDVYLRDLGGGDDFIRRCLRNDAQRRLFDCQRRFEFIPGAHAVFVVENRATLVAAPQVLNQCIVKNSAGHQILSSMCRPRTRSSR